jgi:hypothetical protein
MTGVQGGDCSRKCSASSKETLSLAQRRKSTLTGKGVLGKRRQALVPASALTKTEREEL